MTAPEDKEPVVGSRESDAGDQLQADAKLDEALEETFPASDPIATGDFSAPRGRMVKIDYISDVMCPWCAVGLYSLLEALDRTRPEIEAEIVFQPFELNPDMPPGGENGTAYVARKYGLPAEQAARNRAIIRERAAAVGLDMAALDTRRLYNSFDAHRLIHWAAIEGRQLDLKRALFEAHFTLGEDVSNADVLVRAAEAAGLDGEAAREVVSSGAYAEEVRAAEALWQARGVQSVPTIIIDGRYLISGGQPPGDFERILRLAAARKDAA